MTKTEKRKYHGGGGRGKKLYRLIDGDYPVASLRGIKTWSTTLNSSRVDESDGGGRGVLASAPGDFPVAALRGVKTQQSNAHTFSTTKNASSVQDVQSNMVTDSTGDIRDCIVYHKNCRSLSNDDRLEELLMELEIIDVLSGWDAVLLNET